MSPAESEYESQESAIFSGTPTIAVRKANGNGQIHSGTNGKEASYSPPIFSDNLADTLVAKARRGAELLRSFSQGEVDAICHEFALVTYERAEEWARLAVAETGLGNVADKIKKKRSKSEQIWNQVKDEKTVGVIEHDHDKRLMKIAEPVGVVAGVAPCTNPVVTAMSYAILCIKTRNALIVSPHPRAEQVTRLAVSAMIERGAARGLPREAIQVLSGDGLSGGQFLELSRDVMTKSNMVVATGGPSVVNVAYRSGTPAYGVGAGNTPVIIHPSADLGDAARKIIEGRCFDNGIICASEQSVIVPNELFAKFQSNLVENGTRWIEGPEVGILESLILEDPEHFNPSVFGKSAREICHLAGLSCAEDVRTLAVEREPSLIGKDVLSGEKLFPLLTLYRAPSFNVAVDLARLLLEFQGAGHTAVLHIEDNGFLNKRDLQQWSLAMPATHLIINQASATSAGGSKMNWMTASTTLGCGSYGGTTPMESVNLSVKQLLNFKVLCMPLPRPRYTGHLI